MANGFHPFRGTILDQDYWNLRRGFSQPIRGEASATGLTPPPAGSGPQVPWGQGRWWETPDVRFQGGQAWDPRVGEWSDVAMPSWLEGYTAPEWYDLYHQMPESIRASTVLTLMSQGRDDARTTAAQDAGRDWLQAQLDRVEAGADSWAADPARQAVMGRYEEQSQPGYQFFSPAERSAAVLPLARQQAANQSMLAGQAAAHGISGSGLDLQQRAISRGIAQSGGTQIRAGFDTANRALQQAALDALARTTGAYEGVDLAYLGEQDRLAGALANLEMGVEFEPTDFTVFPMLAEAERSAREEAEFRDRELRRLEEESRWGLDDLIETLLSAGGTGYPEAILGFLS